LTKEAIKDFLVEARIIARLVHPHIVRILEFDVEGEEPDLEQSILNIEEGTPFLVMDYASGGTLRQRHPKGTRLSLDTVISYTKQVAEALEYAHQNKLIHRDIKPENMLIGSRDEILLSDFGIAVIAHSEHSMTTQQMAGTIPYMAPEQIRGKPQPASDQYSLGIVAYEWLSGTRPFQGSSPWDIMNQHLSSLPPSLRENNATISKEVEHVVLKALSKDPQQRFASVADFARALASAHE
jgi:serine/threonine protein kinase